ncbi:MAG: hypothetical protein ACYC91_16725 [Solirubrobacteraceae bacterium]
MRTTNLEPWTSAQTRANPVLGALPERFEAFGWHSYWIDPHPGR